MTENTIELEGLGTIRIERINGLKLTRMLAITKAISRKVPGIVGQIGTFRREYAERNAIVLDRATAVMRFGERLERMTDEDWKASGNRLTVPVEPSTAEVIAAVYGDVLEAAEAEVLRLLALITLSNGAVIAAWKEGTLTAEDGPVALRVDRLLEAPADDLLELAVIAGEVLQDQYTSRRDKLGDRLGNAFRLFGLDPSKMTPESRTPTTTPTSSTPTSSTDTPASTDGDPTSPSEPPPISSPVSANAPEPTMSEPPPNGAPRLTVLP